MFKLPFWRLTNKTPAFYDTESGTAIEQTAKVYAAMQEMTEDFIKFTQEMATRMTDFQDQISTSDTEFKRCMCELMENYIQSVDHKVNEIIAYMKTHLDETATQLINEAIRNGNIEVATEYNEATEELNIVGTGGV